MQTLRLNINDSVYERFLVYLQKFDKSQIEVINENKEFRANQKYLRSELDDIDNGKAEFVTLDDLDSSINELIGRYENNIL